MKPEVLEALKKSIKHWEELRDGESKQTIGPHSCALCQMFWKLDRISSHKVRCDGCPVAVRSGKIGCLDTPYDLMSDAQWTLEYESEFDWQQSGQFKHWAELELKFLVSLLPFDEWLKYQYGSNPPPDCLRLKDDKDCLDRNEYPCQTCSDYVKAVKTYEQLQTQPMEFFNE